MLIPSLPENPHLFDVFKNFPNGVESLLNFHDDVLRGPSPLTAGERELIAAYVSGLNACQFCFNSHVEIAAAFDIQPRILDELLDDVEQASVSSKLKPMLSYVKKLTLTPSRLTPKDADNVRQAGWSDLALVDAVKVCSLFNFMNRLVFGTGVSSLTVKRLEI